MHQTVLKFTPHAYERADGKWMVLLIEDRLVYGEPISFSVVDEVVADRDTIMGLTYQWARIHGTQPRVTFLNDIGYQRRVKQSFWFLRG